MIISAIFSEKKKIRVQRSSFLRIFLDLAHFLPCFMKICFLSFVLFLFSSLGSRNNRVLVILTIYKIIL